MNHSSPLVEPQPSAEQRSRSRRDERSRSRERTPPRSSPQDLDESSATVDPQNRVSDRSRSHQEREDSRRSGPQQQRHDSSQQRGKKTVAERQSSESPKTEEAQVYWFRWRRWRASKWTWNFFKHPTCCLFILLMKTVNTARNIVHKVRTLEGQYPIQISMYWPTKSIGQWHLRHRNMPQRLDRFAFQSLKLENNKVYAIWSPCRVCNDHYISMKRPTATNLQNAQVPDGVDGQTRNMLERRMTTCGRAARTRAKMRSRARKEASAQEVRGYYKQFCWSKTSWIQFMGW